VALAATVALYAPTGARADDAPAPPPPLWSGKGMAGAVMSRGNTDADTANVKLDFAHNVNLWQHTLHLEELYARTAGVVSAERFGGLLQSNYQFTPRAFAFAAAHYEKDLFSGFVYQASLTSGLGYKFVDTATDKLAGQLGAGYRRLQPELLTKDASGAVIGRTPEASGASAIATAGIDGEHDFNASTKLTEKLRVEYASIDTTVQNDLALTVKMSQALALSVGFTVHENTKPPAGLKRVDTLTTLDVVYQFL
jgi:putative salt-induced outer membrane protein